MVLYDRTSSWLEGRCGARARFGYSRAGRRAKLQIVFGLLGNAPGSGRAGRRTGLAARSRSRCSRAIPRIPPPSRTRSPSSRSASRAAGWCWSQGQARGPTVACSPARASSKPAGLDGITALRAPAIPALAADSALQLSLFDQRDLAEITSPDYPGERLVVCRNPDLAAERRRKREELHARL